METPDSTREVPTYMKTIYDANRRMYENRTSKTTDVEINVKKLGDKPFYAHKYIIESRCPNMWSRQNKPDSGNDKTIKIIVDKVELTEFAMNEIIKYFYTDCIELTSKNTFEVLVFSKNYDLPLLEKKCKKYVDCNINEKTVCKILEDSIFYNFEKIAKSCEEYIASYTKKVLENENFLKASATVVHKITTFEKLNVDEIVLFEKCIEWAKKQPPPEAKTQSTPDGSNENTTDQKGPATDGSEGNKTDGEKLRQALTAAGDTESCYIRFPTMKLVDFNTRVVPTRFLKPEEIVEIYNYLTAPDNKKPDTPRFNGFKRQRTRTPVDPKYAPRSEF